MRHVWAKNIKSHNTECVKCGVRPEWEGSRLSCPGFLPGLKEATETYGHATARLLHRSHKQRKHAHEE